MNKTMVMGRLTKDPELRQTNSGVAVCNFTLAVDRRVKPGEEKQADFITCCAWAKTAEFLASHFTKGRNMAAVGHLQSWKKNNDGKLQYGMDVIVEEIYFADSKPAGSSKPTDDDDFPF